jgi:hypothetical protein
VDGLVVFLLAVPLDCILARLVVPGVDVDEAVSPVGITELVLRRGTGLGTPLLVIVQRQLGDGFGKIPHARTP